MSGNTEGQFQLDAHGNFPAPCETDARSSDCSGYVTFSDRRNVSEETEDVKVLKSDLTRDTYEIDTARYPNKGKVLIFNNINFDNGLADRIGSDQDASTMYQRFSDLGFEPSLYTDKKHDEIMEILKGVAMDDHSSASCFACVVLSHGDEDGIWAVDKLAPVLRTEDIMATVNSKCCKTLVNKPKIFIIQACRGSTSDYGIEARVEDDDETVADALSDDKEYKEHLTMQEAVYETVRLPTDADFLLIQATVHGRTSIRNTQTGSPFIQFLSDEMSDMAETDDFVEVLTRVNRRMAFNFTAGHGSRNIKQMPCFTSMLTKKLPLKKGC